MKKNKSKILLFIVVSFLLFSLLQMHLKHLSFKAGIENPDLTRTNMPIYILGSTRNILADILWIRIDLYHHSWEWGGNYWSNNQNLIMLYRIVSYLNPNQEKAYAQGAYHLAFNLHKEKEALEFLKEGLANNPDSYDINFEMGFEQFFIYEDYEQAIKYLEKALSLTESKEDILINLKLIAHAYYNLKDYETSLTYWNRVFHLAPNKTIPIKWIKEIQSLQNSEKTR